MIQFAIRYLLAFTLFLFSGMRLWAQNPALETVSMPPSVDPQEIADIRQDAQGYLWLATGSGLMRFDGYTWKVYQHDPKNANSLAGNNIRSICPTRDGLIWVGGWNSGLDCLNPRTDKVTHYQVIKRKEYKYEDNVISALVEDHLGNLWVGTVGGLYRLDKASEKFIPYLSVAKKARTLSHKHVSSIYEDRQGTLWVGTGDQGGSKLFEGGLNKLDRKTNTFTRYLNKPGDANSLIENRVLAIFEDSRGTFWVGTGGDGLHTMDRKSGKFTRYPFQDEHSGKLSRPFPKEKNLRTFPTSGIRFIQEDAAGAIWIGTFDAGANRYEPASGLVTKYATPADGFPDFNLFSACLTRDGTLWMGTIPGHLIKIVTTNSPIAKVKMPSGVHYFQEDTSGTLWIGTIVGLTAADPVTKEAGKWLGEAARQTGLLTDHVTRLNSDRQGNRWISTWNNGLYQYQLTNGKFTHYLHDSLNMASISPGEAAGFYQDRSGANWVLTAGGLDKLDTKTGKFIHYRHQERDTTSLRNDYILVVKEDHAGAFWVGTNGGGLNLMDRATGKFKHFLAWSIVTELVEDASATLWVASSLGLHRYDRKRGVFVPFIDPGSGKQLSFVRSIVEDNEGNLWAAMPNGIAAISANRRSMRWFGANYGISPGEDFFFGGSYKRRDGSIYFGSMEKYFHFQPKVLLKHHPITPLLHFSAFRVHNQLITLPAKSVELAYNQNVFSIDFAAIDFRHPELHLYTYKLENYDLEWRPVSAERTANYFNVPPGKFKLRVRAANSDGIWVEKSIMIFISPPWWRTGWAFAVYVLMLAGLFFGGWQVLLRRERAKSAFNIREMKAQQLLEMDRLKSDFFANVTHEFRTPLTLILSPLEHWLSNMPDDDPYAQPFRSMRTNGRRLLHLVNQLLDLSKLDAGKMQLKTQPGDLIHLVHRIASSFSAIAENRGIAFQVTAPEGSLWLSFDADKLEKILNNLLSNAFKFTPDNGQVSLSMLLAPVPEIQKKPGEKPFVSAELKVTDSGTGIPPDQLERIFDRFHQVDHSLAREQEGSGIGLALTRELVELQGGTIAALSSAGQGSQFVVSMPLELLHPGQLGQQQAFFNPVSQEVSSISDIYEPLALQENQQVSGNANPDAPLVLVVEDNADLRNFICQSLTQHSAYRILKAIHGMEGYSLAQEHIPDLVISDIMMPKMDGIEFCRRLKTNEKTSHIPIILLTAKASGENKLHGLQTGADDYLTKPFEVKELLTRVHNLIEGRRQLKERYTRQVTLQPSNIAITSTDEQFLNRTMAIIERYMAEEHFSVEVFGREIGMSRMQLYRKLQALTGQSPSDFIRTVRLQRAAQLLSANSGTVSQIADQVGFASHSYFSKCFQEQYGKSPSAFVAELDRAHK
ncbi:hybrid sensor histidine kinase/response regulator transcription factor [Dyadobacter arcticus]|uniref:histidine kinase n=1 Tax=Dyadobacter arcticus TaxID=1078754 RepID=A0ABX0UND5_9BACT|nr:hybrid sensor histidine kinase/response regulator transcription factor [Dyadobacter arcticus]NIJ54442.1 signal transduction histidine kinase/ligand-binding sensor domain-containing protein/DNA-binding response OmpR family regulator [Dyadobacter arcticus]